MLCVQQHTVQMERWDGTVWDISKTCDQLGTKYLQILSMCNVTGSASTSYLFVKGKVSALNILMVGDIPELNLALGLSLDASSWCK